ncbi:MAG: hypothetical protein JSS81_19855 [Acidobacteria bacterium]|nr:hypothetical protein [Acidobacteriota bacterium]
MNPRVFLVVGPILLGFLVMLVEGERINEQVLLKSLALALVLIPAIASGLFSK